MKPIHPTILIILFAAMVWPLLKLVARIHLWFWRLGVKIGTSCYFIDFQSKKFSGKIIDMQRPIRKGMRYTRYLFRGNIETIVLWLPASSLYYLKYRGNYEKGLKPADEKEIQVTAG